MIVFTSNITGSISTWSDRICFDQMVRSVNIDSDKTITYPPVIRLLSTMIYNCQKVWIFKVFFFLKGVLVLQRPVTISQDYGSGFAVQTNRSQWSGQTRVCTSCLCHSCHGQKMVSVLSPPPTSLAAPNAPFTSPFSPAYSDPATHQCEFH